MGSAESKDLYPRHKPGSTTSVGSGTPAGRGGGGSLTRIDSDHKGERRDSRDKAVRVSHGETSKEQAGEYGEYGEYTQICKMCGKVFEEADIKHIPSCVAWLSFSCLFICCFWWLSWIPFIVDQKHCNICKKPVKVCPYCYRRIDRPPV